MSDLINTEPLGDALDRVDADCSASENLARWLRLTLQREECAAFERKLSVAQRNSHHLLKEWLTLVASTGVDLQTALSEGSLSQEMDPMTWEDRTTHGPRPRTSYHVVLSQLLFSEFAPYNREKRSAILITIALLRKEAAIWAASHRTSLNWYSAASSSSQRECNADEDDHRDTEPFTTAPVGACVNPCPWLENDPAAAGLPYFLWDAEQFRTVKVEELDSIQPYIALSHTWGRWQRRDPETDEPILASVKGVPWLVPENDRFDVRRLPELLLQLRGARYVWIDLFCIPQDRSSLARREIAKQAAIFRNSSEAIAWLNDVSGWTNLESALQWMLAQYINRKANDTFFSAQMPQRPNAPASHPIEFFNKLPNTQDALEDDILNPWFTSLWTLQEFCLRPDMHFYDRNFLPLCPQAGLTPVSLADIAALFWCLDAETAGSALVEQLFSLLARLGLLKLFGLTPAIILRLGNLRYCRRRRAEAIMSAVGATEWFSRGENSESLVLGLYPLSFIEELRSKRGSGLFFSEATIKFDILQKILYWNDYDGPVELVGSMLPFGDGKQINSHDNLLTSSEDSAVASWTIDAAGRVRMKEALLHLLDDQTDTLDLSCSFAAPLITDDILHISLRSGTIKDLRLWMNYYKPEFRNYAVCLMKGPRQYSGILLKELASGVLIRVGSYTIWSNDSSQSMGTRSKMEWLVI